MNAFRFVSYEIHGVKDYGTHATVCPGAEADFWCIYGLLVNSKGASDYVCIGDFHHRNDAELVLELIGKDVPRSPGDSGKE